MNQTWTYEKAMRISRWALGFFTLLWGASILALRYDLLSSENGRLFTALCVILSALMVVFHLASMAYLALGKWLEPRLNALKQRQQEHS